MNPTHYYLDCNNSLQTKNKLQAEFGQFLHSLQGLIIDADKLPKLKKEILDKAEELNTTFSRCTPIGICFRENTATGTVVVQGFYAVTFYIKPGYYESN